MIPKIDKSQIYKKYGGSDIDGGGLVGVALLQYFCHYSCQRRALKVIAAVVIVIGAMY